MVFCPNLFAHYSADFVHIENRILTIAAVPDVETMLHETLHSAMAQYQKEIISFAVKYGLSSFANREKMLQYGYMNDESSAALSHVIEECFVRAFSVVLAGRSERRLQFHAEYGCDSVPYIASQIIKMSPTIKTLGKFVSSKLNDYSS